MNTNRMSFNTSLAPVKFKKIKKEVNYQLRTTVQVCVVWTR